MVERRRDEKADAQKHEPEAGALQSLTGGGNVFKKLLENGLKKEPEQDLRPQYQEAGFVERSFKLPIQIHRVFPDCNNLAEVGFH
jgi:hypothetical protein